MKKIGLIGLALLLALGALGVTFAGWTDTVTVNGTVGTGEVCIEWFVDNNTDVCPHGTEGDNYYDGQLDWNLDVEEFTGNPDGYPNTYLPRRLTDKNVACTTVTGHGTDTLHITVDNAYPLYYNDIEIEWINCGTIPIKLQSFDLNPLNFTLASAPWTPDANDALFIEVSTTAPGAQYEPWGPRGDSHAHSLKFVVQQKALQNHAYEFEITVNVVQWNEYEGT
jgi:predicted ribosomally synthesized peptide with SipW-like signal peptide